MSRIIYLLTYIAMVCLFSCSTQNEPYQELLQRAKQLNNIIPTSKWYVEQYYFTDIEDYFALRTSINDTSYYLRLYKSNMPDSLVSRRFYLLLEKKFKIGDTLYNLIMDTDTLCYYKHPIYDSNEKFFYVGKYYFLYSDPDEMERFSLCQHYFFQNHIDSLVRIKGNDLPELPCDSSYQE